MEFVSPTLKMYVESLNDLEEIRIRTDNRLRSLTQHGTSEGGHEFGLGLDPESPEVKKYADLAEAFQTLEDTMIKSVTKEIKNSPVGAYVASQKGIGEKTVARLLGEIGDPYWHTVEDRPRTVSELWAYCGYHVIDGHAPRREKGKQSNWSTEAKKRAWLIAKSVEKQKPGSKYRDLYDSVKEKYGEEPVHTTECARCTPAGAKPAVVGSPMKKSHVQGIALRRVAKEVLKDLWITSRDWHVANQQLETIAA